MQSFKFQKLVPLAMVLAAGQAFSGCDGADVAVAVGAGAIVAGAVVIAANTRCVGGYREYCHDYINYWGQVVTECRQVYDTCLYTEPVNVDANPQASGAQEPDPIANGTVTDVHWSEAFGIGFDGSEKFIAAMKGAKSGDLHALTNLGFNRGDLKKLASYQLPADKSIDAVAENLGQSVGATRAMLEQLLEVAQAKQVGGAH